MGLCREEIADPWTASLKIQSEGYLCSLFLLLRLVFNFYLCFLFLLLCLVSNFSSILLKHSG